MGSITVSYCHSAGESCPSHRPSDFALALLPLQHVFHLLHSSRLFYRMAAQMKIKRYCFLLCMVNSSGDLMLYQKLTTCMTRSLLSLYPPCCPLPLCSGCYLRSCDLDILRSPQCFFTNLASVAPAYGRWGSSKAE